jgi:hypothetical protein
MMSPSCPSCSSARLLSNHGPFTVFHSIGGSGTFAERAAAAPNGVAAPYDMAPENQRRNRGRGFRTGEQTACRIRLPFWRSTSAR